MRDYWGMSLMLHTPSYDYTHTNVDLLWVKLRELDITRFIQLIVYVLLAGPKT